MREQCQEDFDQALDIVIDDICPTLEDQPQAVETLPFEILHFICLLEKGQNLIAPSEYGVGLCLLLAIIG